MVVCENWQFSEILHIVFILAAISKGHKWVRRWKIFSWLILNMVWWDPVQKQEKRIFEGHRSTFCIKVPFGIEHPPPPTHQMQSICMQKGSGVPNLQIELNYLDLFKSYCIFSDFVVPIIPMSSLSSPCHPHIVPVIPRWSPGGPHTPMTVVSVVSTPCGPHIPMVPTSSPWSPHHPHHPHIIPTIPTSSPHHLEGPYIIPNAPDSC